MNKKQTYTLICSECGECYQDPDGFREPAICPLCEANPVISKSVEARLKVQRSEPKQLTEEQVIEDKLVKLVEPILGKYKKSLHKGLSSRANLDFRNFASHDIIKVVIAKLRTLGYKSPSEIPAIERARDERWMKRLGEVGICAVIPDDIPDALYTQNDVDALEKVAMREAGRAAMERVFERLDDELGLMGNPEGTPEYYMIGKEELEALKSELLGNGGEVKCLGCGKMHSPIYPDNATHYCGDCEDRIQGLQ